MFGDSFPADYVFANANITYSATVANPSALWDDVWPRLKSAVGAQFRVVGSEQNRDSASIFFNIVSPGDFGSIQHIKQLIDGIMYSLGYQLRASAVQFITNPRRDGATQQGTLPKAAGNVSGGGPPSDAITTALDFYFGGIANKLGVSSTVLVGVGAAIVLLLVLKK